MEVLLGSNLAMIRGDSESITIHRVGPNKETIPFTLGDTLRFTVRKFASDADAILAKTITTFHEGKAIIPIEPEDTKSLTPSECVYDIELTDFTGAVRTIVGPSKFVIWGDVTHG